MGFALRSLSLMSSFLRFCAESQGPARPIASFAVWLLVSNVFSGFGFCDSWGT